MHSNGGNMNFKSGRIKDFYLLATDVENIFINEYMPAAPGDYVKVYLYALLYAKQGLEMTHENLARELGMSAETVDEAWTYWAKMGTVKIVNRRPKTAMFGYDIEFVNLRELMYSGMSFAGGGAAQTTQAVQEEEPAGEKKSEFSDFNAEDILCRDNMQEVFSFAENLKGRPLSAKEMKSIASWHDDYNIDKDLIKKAIEYCFERDKTSIRYLEAVIREWHELGIKTAEEADAHTEKLTKRFGDYKRIMYALGIVSRTASDGEKKIIDRWLDEMGFSMERILDACQRTVGIANPNVNYVNKILENWKKDAAVYGRDVNKKTTVTQAVLNKYYDYLRQEAERKAQERREKVYSELPRLAEIDDSLKDLGSRLSRAVLGGKAGETEEIKRLTALLEQERAILLTENNYPMDFTDIHYLCDACHDTGIDESGRRCVCAKERIGEAELWLNSTEKK